MEISEWSINAFLIFCIVSGSITIILGIWAIFRGEPNSSRNVWSGAWSIIIGICSLALFRNGIVQDTWVLWMAVCVLLGIPYLPGMVKDLLEELRGSAERDRDHEEAERNNWDKTQAKGRGRFIGLFMLSYGYGALSLAIPVKIIVLDWFPTYLFVLVIAGFIVWGYVYGARTWERNEKLYGSN